MVQPRGKFQFNRNNLEDFWDSYYSKLNSEKEPIIGIAEKPQHYLPVLVDIDIKIKDEGGDYGEHLYTSQQVTKVIEIYQSVLRNIVDQCNDDHLLCLLLEKNTYYITTGENMYAKNGFHLHFPNLFVNKVDQEIHLIPRVQELLKKHKIFSNLGITNSDEVVDKACCKVPWLMYGSRKSEDMDPYRLTKAFNSNLTELSINEALKNYKLYNVDEQILNIDGRIDEYLHRILSIIPFGRETSEIKPGLVSPLKEKIADERIKKRNILKFLLPKHSKIQKNYSKW